METIPRKTLTEDEWNRKNHVWKNADPVTRGDGRDFNGIDNYQQYLDSLNGVQNWNTSPEGIAREFDPNYVPEQNNARPIPRLNVDQGIRNDGTVAGSMPQALRDYFNGSGGTPPSPRNPLFGTYRDWLNRINSQQNWNQYEANAFGDYLQSFNNGATWDSIPRAQNLILK